MCVCVPLSLSRKEEKFLIFDVNWFQVYVRDELVPVDDFQYILT